MGTDLYCVLNMNEGSPLYALQTGGLLPGKAGSLWLSVLVQLREQITSYLPIDSIQLIDSKHTNVMDAGSDNERLVYAEKLSLRRSGEGPFWLSHLENGVYSSKEMGPADLNSHLVLMHFQQTGDAVEFSLFWDPAIPEALNGLASPDFQSSGDFGFDTLYFRSNLGQLLIDELRIGETVAEVLPVGSFFGGNLGYKTVHKSLTITDAYYPFIYSFSSNTAGWWWMHQSSASQTAAFAWSFDKQAWLWVSSDYRGWVYAFAPYDEWMAY
ncbi:MAG: hypothetical protein SFY80_04510 [Verrucomicrobiota bacterium]|nr:hypothetical protein [Verrucomicrobiota bacterium]